MVMLITYQSLGWSTRDSIVENVTCRAATASKELFTVSDPMDPIANR